MIRELVANDDIWGAGEATPRWQVMSPRPRAGCVKDFDYLAREEVYKPMAEICDGIVAGQMFVKRLEPQSQVRPVKLKSDKRRT